MFSFTNFPSNFSTWYETSILSNRGATEGAKSDLENFRINDGYLQYFDVWRTHVWSRLAGNFRPMQNPRLQKMDKLMTRSAVMIYGEGRRGGWIYILRTGDRTVLLSWKLEHDFRNHII
jgi:hypothetical protein